MRKVQEILRLHFESELSQREIADSLNVSVGVVNKYIHMFTSSGQSWPINDPLLLSQLLKPSKDTYAVNYAEVHQELQYSKMMTLQLVWEEYTSEGKTSISYSHFARQYNQWKDKQPSSMRKTHVAGESLYIDYSGDKITLIDSETGEPRTAELFVGLLGASNYIYLEATWSQKLPDWIGSHKRMFEHLEGVPRILIVDNLKSGVTSPSLYEPDLNPTYAQFVAYYGSAVIPARPYKPKDKATAENGVLIVQRWVLMRLRKLTITGLAQLNQILRELMIEANLRKFKKLPYNRITAFMEIDKPALLPLPAIPYNFKQYKLARVGNDYHVHLETHYYSVPYHYVGEQVELWYDSNTVEVYSQLGNCIAKHIRSNSPGNTTLTQHMTQQHKKTVEWTPERCIAWAKTVGAATIQMVERMLECRAHNMHSRRSCMGLMSLAKRYTPQRLESVCSYALTLGVSKRKDIEALLKNNMDNLLLESKQTQVNLVMHSNIRGSQNYA